VLAQQTAAAAVRASLVTPLLQAAALLAKGKAAGGAALPAKAALLAEATLKSMAARKVRLAAGLLLAVVLAGSGMAFHASRAPRAGQTELAIEQAVPDTTLGELHNWNQINGGVFYGGNASGSVLASVDPPGIIFSYLPVNGKASLRIASNAYTVTMGPGTATTQQVVLNGTGSMQWFGGQALGNPVPVRVTLVVKLTATPVNGSVGGPLNLNLATATFRAVNASTGQSAFSSGVLNGFTSQP
jgi:hypothetical protein